MIEFTPKSGPIGTQVTLYGTGYDPTASQVTFNGVAAVVLSASATQIVTHVPTGATTGPISVSTPTGSATSSTHFTVTAGSGTGGGQAPTITSFSPTIGTPGTAVTINGTHFLVIPSKNKVSFHTSYAVVSAATTTSLTTSVPSTATSGPLSVTTPFGTAISSGDFFIPPAPYTAADMRVSDRIVIDGSSKTVTLPTAHTIAMLVFDGVQGQRVSLGMTNVTIGTATCCGTDVTLYTPDGKSLATSGVSTNGGVLDTRLPVSGTYTIVVDPRATNTGSMTVTLSAEITGTLPLLSQGSTLTVHLARPGQRARLTFTGSAGQGVSLQMSDVTIGTSTCCSTDVAILKPDGGNLVTAVVGTTGEYLDSRTLPTSGTYTILVDPRDTSTGRMTLTLAADVTGTITPGGAAVTVTFSIPGQKAWLSFSGNAGQQVSVQSSGVTAGLCATLKLFNPDDTTLFSSSRCGNTFVDTQTLAATGTYLFLIDPSGNDTGSLTFNLYDVVDVSSTLTFGGSAVTPHLTTPGQKARLSLSGTAGQRAFVDLSANTIGTTGGCPTMTLVKPDGTSLASPTICTPSSFIDIQSLPTTGTYTVIIDPASNNTGSLTVKLSQKPPDVITTMTPGGTVTVSTFAPDQEARLTFAGTVGQRVSLALSSGTLPSSTVTLYTPLGTTLAATTVAQDSEGFIDTQTLPVTGTYTVVVDPAGSRSGDMTLSLYAVPPDDRDRMNFQVVGPTAGMGVFAHIDTTVPGQNAFVEFDGLLGQRVFLHLHGVTITRSLVSLYNPDGTLLAGPVEVEADEGFVDTQTLPAIGTYKITVNPQGAATGSMEMTLYPVAPNLTAPIVIGGLPQPVALSIGQNASLLFLGQAGQSVTVWITDNSILEDCVTVTLRGSDGAPLTSTTRCDASGLDLEGSFNLDTQTLSTTGLYTIHVDPFGDGLGLMNLSVTSP